MSALLLSAFLFQAGQASGGAPTRESAGCSSESHVLLSQASQRVAEDNLYGALERLAWASAECQEAEVAAIYIGGLAAAREAFKKGGSAESLAPVRQAISRLEGIAQGKPGPPEIARLTLLAAASAAQSERDEMAVFLEEATRLEVLQMDASQPGAPLFAALEAAGDLWLQLHRYDAARAAYTRARTYLGHTTRLARAFERLDKLERLKKQ